MEEKSFRGYTAIELSVTSPTKQIVLHSYVNHDSARTKITKTDKLGDMSEVKVEYEFEDNEFSGKRGYYRIICEEELQPNQHDGVVYTLELYFNSTMKDDYGFFIKDDGGGDLIAATQLEMVRARLVFPCFDEPRLKAKFTVELEAPDGYQAY